MSNSKPLNIIEVIADPNSVTYFNHFAELSKNHPEVKLSFVCLNNTPTPMLEDMAARGCDAYWIKYHDAKRKRSWPSAYFALKKLFKKLRPDLVHSHLFDDGVPAMLAAKHAKVPMRVHTKQCTAFNWYHAPKAVHIDRLINRWATHLIAVSEESKDFLINKEHAPEGKIHLIHHGIDLETFNKPNQPQIQEFKQKYLLQGKKVVASVSRYIEWKGYKTFIEAASTLATEFPDVIFLGIGSGPQEDELRNLIRQKGLEDRFILTGWIDKSLIPAVFASIDVYVHCAFMEPFGFVIPEAMANKIPIVSTSTGSARDGLVHLESGYLTPYHDHIEIANGIRYMLTTNTTKITENAYQTVINKFTIESMWQQHLDLYLGRS
jgi:glycosyltransferase involved in cell wall biosynthesis